MGYDSTVLARARLDLTWIAERAMKLLNRGVLGWILSVAMAVDATASVIVVDLLSGPGSQFSSIQDAANAAAEGDIILVRPGQHLIPVVLPDKSLTIQGDGPFVELLPFGCSNEFKIQGLSAGKRVVLRGLKLRASICLVGPSSSVGLTATNNAGTVWIDDCSGGSIYLDNCSEFVFTNSAFSGGKNTAALTAKSSNVFLHGTKLTGAEGIDGFSSSTPVFNQPGGTALSVSGSGSALITNSDLLGGQGGDGFFDIVCYAAGVGGPAIEMGTGNPIVRSISSALSAGASGSVFAGCPPTPQGPAVVTQSGSFVETPGIPKKFSAESPVRETNSSTIVFGGTSGSSVLLLFSASSASLSLPQYGGALHLGAPQFVVPFGTIPPSGSLSVAVPVLPLPAGLQGLVVFTQGVICPSASPCALTAPAAIVILDSSL